MNFDFSGLQNGVIQAVASIVIIVLVVRLVMAYLRRGWGEMVGEIAFVMAIGWVVWFPDSAEATLRSITSGITGAA